jgi:hypothetical protein
VNNSPARTSRSTPSRALKFPKLRRSWLNRRIGALSAVGASHAAVVTVCRARTEILQQFDAQRPGSLSGAKTHKWAGSSAPAIIVGSEATKQSSLVSHFWIALLRSQ